MQAFAHGKHVLCDKPSANALAPALEMNRAAEKSGLVFAMMFHQRRYKKYMRLKKLLDDGTLGEIKRVQLENSRYFRTWMYHRSGSWRSSWAGEGGGALLNQGQHLVRGAGGGHGVAQMAQQLHQRCIFAVDIANDIEGARRQGLD